MTSKQKPQDLSPDGADLRDQQSVGDEIAETERAAAAVGVEGKPSGQHQSVTVLDDGPAPPAPVVLPEDATMLERAVAAGAPLETIEKLMDFQDRADEKAARLEFNIAMSEFQPPVIKKTKRVKFSTTDYMHETLAEIDRSVRPLLQPLGLSYHWNATSKPNEPIVVTCIVTHKEGHHEETTLMGPPDETGSKNKIQQITSTITMLKRQTVKLILGLSEEEDPDEDDGKASGGPELIDTNQVEALEILVRETGADLKRLLKFFKVERLNDLAAKEYDYAVTQIKKVAANREKAAAERPKTKGGAGQTL